VMIHVFAIDGPFVPINIKLCDNNSLYELRLVSNDVL
jgi:hypothetical protein